jgi:hypothetical protein
LRRLLAAGFRGFQQLDIKSPTNLFYAARVEQDSE